MKASMASDDKVQQMAVRAGPIQLGRRTGSADKDGSRQFPEDGLYTPPPCAAGLAIISA